MKKQWVNYLAALIIGIIFSIGFTGTHNVQSVDDLAYAVALGIDKGDNYHLRVTFQFTTLSAASESGAGEATPSVVDSVEANSIDTALNLMNTVISKEISLSHCKIIVFSEELASQGIGEEIYSLMNKVQLRPDTNVIISISQAEEYIKSVKPSLENLVAKFYETLPRSSEYTGYTANIQLGDFFRTLTCTTCEPVAILRRYYFIF